MIEELFKGLEITEVRRKRFLVEEELMFLNI